MLRAASRQAARAWAIGVTVVAATVASASLAVPATAATGISYAALGDSYASGVGTGIYYPGSGLCLRSPDSADAQWAAAHDVAGFDFAACGGATTADVLSSQLSGLTAQTNLVTITIGGNDVGFVSVITTCLLGNDSACANAIAAGAQEATSMLPGRLASTYAAIRAAAPNARLIVIGYPRLYELNSLCLTTMDLYKRTLLNRGADLLDQVIAQQAAAAGATFVDVRSRFAGHGICSWNPWINDADNLLAGPYHPTIAGYTDGYLPALDAVTG